MADEPSQSSCTYKPRSKKLPRLPPNARVEKRPLLHPPIASPYTNAQQPKVIYISTKTPFLSAVKRAEKLLHLADKRLVQSATTLAKQNRGTAATPGKRKRGGLSSNRAAGEDEILDIAQEVERQKSEKGVRNEANEEVVLKGTGKAINKVLELALWFQQREDTYKVQLRTGSVSAIDDITVDESAKDNEMELFTEETPGVEEDDTEIEIDTKDRDREDVDTDELEMKAKGIGLKEDTLQQGKSVSQKKAKPSTLLTEPVPETRVRRASVLEVAVSLI